MNIQIIQDKLKALKLLDNNITKYTLLIDEKMIEQGALFFIPLGNKEIKAVIPAPTHKYFLMNEDKITYKNLLAHKDIIILK
ncbi:hypothetical protein [Sphingobacterium sp. SGL-16]|uniref:hypothetical protein n=1 Tax=Sphingobacterium sp. SGL-16 TaxID=2710883 RepID=UPI0013EC44FC|nr:hypothetical protein [Sphingobacterium sp. SGL-16]NGM71808.1 hypothetical protein [Sphingobacterium sp. SGL-16]